jgi:hypothetical protein
MYLATEKDLCINLTSSDIIWVAMAVVKALADYKVAAKSES